MEAEIMTADLSEREERDRVLVRTAELPVAVNLAHRKHVMVCVHQSVARLEVQYLVYLAGVNQAVAAHKRLVLADGGEHRVEVVQLYEPAAPDVEQPGLVQPLADVFVVRSIRRRGRKSSWQNA